MSTTRPVTGGEHVPKAGAPDSKKEVKKPSPPPVKPTDTIESSSTENKGILAYGWSWVTYLVGGVFEGVSKLWDYTCWLLAKIGIMKGAEPPLPTLTWEEKKSGMEATFAGFKNAPWERLRLFGYTLPHWTEPQSKGFYIELFNQQDEEILEALTDLVHHKLYSQSFYPLKKRDVREKLPTLLFDAYSKPEAERTFADVLLIQIYQNFILDFPEYALEFAKQCFAGGQPASSRFEALAILAKRLELEEKGPVEEFHSEQINGKDAAEVLQQAIQNYYSRLSEEDKRKILANFDTKPFEIDLKRLVTAQREDPMMIPLFDQEHGYNNDSEAAFIAFLGGLERSVLQKCFQAVFAQFPKIKKEYYELIDRALLESDKLSSACLCAYECEPNIYAMRLGVISTSEDQATVHSNHQRILRYHTRACIDLFSAYRDVVVAEKLAAQKGLEQERAEGEFDTDWEPWNLLNRGGTAILDRRTLMRKLHEVEMSPQYKQAAKQVLERLSRS